MIFIIRQGGTNLKVVFGSGKVPLMLQRVVGASGSVARFTRAVGATRGAVLVLSVAFAASLSCSTGSGDAADAGSSPLCNGWSEPGVAFPANFAGFHSWSNEPAVGPDGSTDGLHGVGPLRVYWNAAPPRGSSEFPRCTIIVKETEETDVTKRTVFAMVKRGGDYNSNGAGWEWFSLTDDADGTVQVLWGAPQPPAGETYANQAVGDCNGCHMLDKTNDGVWDTALQLSSF